MPLVFSPARLAPEDKAQCLGPRGLGSPGAPHPALSTSERRSAVFILHRHTGASHTLPRRSRSPEVMPSEVQRQSEARGPRGEAGGRAAPAETEQRGCLPCSSTPMYLHSGEHLRWN